MTDLFTVQAKRDVENGVYLIKPYYYSRHFLSPPNAPRFGRLELTETEHQWNIVAQEGGNYTITSVTNNFEIMIPSGELHDIMQGYPYGQKRPYSTIDQHEKEYIIGSTSIGAVLECSLDRRVLSASRNPSDKNQRWEFKRISGSPAGSPISDPGAGQVPSFDTIDTNYKTIGQSFRGEKYFLVNQATNSHPCVWAPTADNGKTVAPILVWPASSGTDDSRKWAISYDEASGGVTLTTVHSSFPQRWIGGDANLRPAKQVMRLFRDKTSDLYYIADQSTSPKVVTDNQPTNTSNAVLNMEPINLGDAKQQWKIVKA